MSTEISLKNVLTAAEIILKNEVVERHSLFQLQCFILAKEPTIQGKLQQCLREIKSRKKTLDALSLEIAEQKDGLILIDIETEEFNSVDALTNIAKSRKEIKLRSLERKRQSLTSSIQELKKQEKDTSEELLFFCSVFDQLNKREALKPWDDAEVQKEYWDQKFRIEVNTRILLGQLPDVELLKSIQCLHDDSQLKKKCLEMLRGRMQQHASQTPVLEQKNNS